MASGYYIRQIQGVSVDQEERRPSDWVLDIPPLRGQGDETRPSWDTEKCKPTKQEENQDNTMSWKPSKESILRKTKWST